MKLKLLGLCTAFAMCAAAPCQATTVYVEYSGTIFSGIDHVGVFGAKDSNMAGQSYTASYVFDVTFGLGNKNFQSPTQNFIDGGSQFLIPTLSPSLGAQFSLGATTITIDGLYRGIISGVNNGGVGTFTKQDHLVEERNASINKYLDNFMFNFSGNSSGLPATIDTAFSHALAPGDTGSGTFQYCTVSVCSALTLSPTNLTVTLTPDSIATPLPAAFPLFATGLGVLAFLARRRERENAAAIAAT